MSVREKASAASEVRDGVIVWLRRELVGPAPGHAMVQLNGEEILRPQDPPRYRYACGILFPNGVVYSGSEGATAEEREAIENAPAVDAPEQAAETNVANSDEEEEDADIDPTDAAPGTEAASETDEETSTASQFLPSTMGLSFLADVSGGLSISASWAIYEQVAIEGYPPAKDGSPAREEHEAAPHNGDTH